MKRRGIAWVSASVAVILSCNGELANRDGGADASAPNDAGAAHDGAADVQAQPAQCNLTVPFAVTDLDVAEVNPPKDGTQGACTDAELAKLEGTFTETFAAVSPTCASCLFTENADTTNTQFFVWADTQHVNVDLENYGACMGSPLSGGNAACGKASEERRSCLDAACPLDGMGAPIFNCLTLQECYAAALEFDCKPYDQRQMAACGGASNIQAITSRCFDSMGRIDPGIRLLCGGPALADAGHD